MKARNRFVFTVIAITIGLGAGISFLFYLTDKDETSTQQISIAAVGDSIGYNIKNENLSHLPYLVEGVDVFIFNLEGVLVDANKESMCKGLPAQSLFTSNSSFVKYLKLAPVTIGNLGNNHVLDCGAEGIEETKKKLSENNIFSVGAGQNLDEACKPLLVQAQNKRIAFVSYNLVITDLVSADADKAGAAFLDSCRHDFDDIRSQGVDIIVASIHQGIWSADVDEEQIQLVNKLFDAGVDMVIGHSPHIPQAIMAKDGKIAFFSLGNFILRPDYKMPPLAHTTILPIVEFYPDRIDVTIYPIRIYSDGIPHLDNTGEIISRIALLSKKFDTVIEKYGDIGYLSIPRT